MTVTEAQHCVYNNYKDTQKKIVKKTPNFSAYTKLSTITITALFMHKFGNIHILLHTQMHVKCEFQCGILLKRLHRDLVPTHPRSAKITTKVV